MRYSYFAFCGPHVFRNGPVAGECHNASPGYYMEIRRHGVHRGDFGSRVPNQAVTRSVHEHTVRLPVPDSGTNSETLVEPGGQTNLLSEHIRGGLVGQCAPSGDQGRIDRGSRVRRSSIVRRAFSTQKPLCSRRPQPDHRGLTIVIRFSLDV